MTMDASKDKYIKSKHILFSTCTHMLMSNSSKHPSISIHTHIYTYYLHINVYTDVFVRVYPAEVVKYAGILLNKFVDVVKK